MARRPVAARSHLLSHAARPAGPLARRGGALPPGATPTPMRDALGLNDPDSYGAAASKREEAARAALMRNELRAGLSQLPGPKNEYQIVVPELPGEDVLGVSGFHFGLCWVGGGGVGLGACGGRANTDC